MNLLRFGLARRVLKSGMAKKHYIAMSGIHGCMPDYCASLDSANGAVASLANLFELSRIQIRKLERNRTLRLSPEDGAEYCEIVTCDCNDPEQHND